MKQNKTNAAPDSTCVIGITGGVGSANPAASEGTCVIGITGGVGAGKSTVLGILARDYGAYLLPADDIGKEICEPGGRAYDAIRDLFGPGIVMADGRLDRPAMAAAAFADPQLLEQMEKILHPAIGEEIQERIRQSGRPLCVVEAALLLEANYDAFCDEVWYVHARREVRIARLRASRGYTRKKCLQVMSQQLSDREFRRRCAAVIENSGDLDKTTASIRRQLERLTKRSKGAGQP